MSADPSIKVNFFFDAATPSIRNRKNLKKFIISIFREEKRILASINYVFSKDKALRLINKEYLNHNAFTDIITFELSEKNKPIIGEVYISVDRVREDAATYGNSFKDEIHRVIFHGALHLCGFKDKTSSENSGDEEEGRVLSNKILPIVFHVTHVNAKQTAAALHILNAKKIPLPTHVSKL